MPRSGRIQWNYEQRVCLHLLSKHEQKLSKSERTRVYNHIFKDHLAACGFPAGAHAGRLRIQYAEHTKAYKSTWVATWEHVCNPPDTDEDRALRARLAAQIDDVLRQGEPVGATLSVATPPQTPRRTDRARKATQNPYDWYAGPEPITPVRQQQVDVQDVATSNPYATPGPSTRKRPATIATRLPIDDDDDELLHDESDYLPKAKKTRRSSPTVEVPPFRPDVTYQTPQATKGTPKRREVVQDGEKMALMRASGKVLMLRPELHARASLPMRSVSEAEAHPALPGFVSRYWHDKSHGINSHEGFTAGKFIPQRILVEPPGPPPCANVDMNDFGNHLNNSGTDQDGIPSPL